MNKNWLLSLVALCAIGAGLILYFPVNPQQQASPAIIHVGVLPDQDAQDLRKRYNSLLAYLAAETGLQFKLRIPSSYSELVQLIGEDAVDLAYLGGFTFLQAHAKHKAEPLIMRDVDMRFTSLFLVKGNSVLQDLNDFKGKVMSFGSRQSTSGHLMPRHFMKAKKQINPEEFFTQILYSEAHDKTAYMIRDGKADVGVANAEIIRSMILDGRLKKDDLHVIWETPPYPDYVWTVKNNLPEDVKTKLRNAFLGLEIDNIDQETILTGMGAKAFFPTGFNDFLPLKEVADSLGLLEPEKL